MTLFSPVLFPSAAIASATPAVLPGTAPLAEGHGGVGNWDGVISAEIDRATAARPQHWKRYFSSTANYDRSIEPNRTRFAHIIGARVPFDAPALLATVDQPALAGRGKSYDVHRVSWPAFGDVHAEGLLLEPRERKPVAAVVAVPDCAQTPEQICGLAPGVVSVLTRAPAVMLSPMQAMRIGTASAAVAAKSVTSANTELPMRFLMAASWN
jgi:hypothetical protein